MKYTPCFVSGCLAQLELVEYIIVNDEVIFPSDPDKIKCWVCKHPQCPLKNGLLGPH